MMRDDLRFKRNIAAAHHPDAAEQVLNQFKPLSLPADSVLAGYIAINNEISPAPILQYMAAQNVPLCLPVTAAANAPLEFYAWQPGQQTAPGTFNIHEPVARERMIPRVLLIPLLGFDRRGNRIGYGKGFYDRTLAALRAENKSILAIGLAYAEQEVPEIPAQPHDQPLNIIVTPRETIYCLD